MKTKCSKWIGIFILFLSAYSVSAQYSTGLGIRFGDPSRGLTVIQYFDPKSRGAADFIFSSQYKGLCFTGLYEVHSKNHNENIELAKVGFYLGVGAHGGAYHENAYYKNPTSDKKIIAAGFDAIAGIEWKLPNIPVLLSADLKPFFDLTSSGRQLNYLDYAVSLRYLFY